MTDVISQLSKDNLPKCEGMAGWSQEQRIAVYDKLIQGIGRLRDSLETLKFLLQRFPEKLADVVYMAMLEQNDLKVITECLGRKMDYDAKTFINCCAFGVECVWQLSNHMDLNSADLVKQFAHIKDDWDIVSFPARFPNFAKAYTAALVSGEITWPREFWSGLDQSDAEIDAWVGNQRQLVLTQKKHIMELLPDLVSLQVVADSNGEPESWMAIVGRKNRVAELFGRKLRQFCFETQPDCLSSHMQRLSLRKSRSYSPDNALVRREPSRGKSKGRRIHRIDELNSF